MDPISRAAVLNLEALALTGLDLETFTECVKQEMSREAVRRAGTKSAAARILGVHRNTINRHTKETR
jgi:transcriptional regulator of acetoin/glycerol metabolism